MALLPEWLRRASSDRGVLALTIGENSVRYAFATSAGAAQPTLAAWGIEERGHLARQTFLKRVRSSRPCNFGDGAPTSGGSLCIRVRRLRSGYDACCAHLIDRWIPNVVARDGNHLLREGLRYAI